MPVSPRRPFPRRAPLQSGPTCASPPPPHVARWHAQDRPSTACREWHESGNLWRAAPRWQGRAAPFGGRPRRSRARRLAGDAAEGDASGSRRAPRLLADRVHARPRRAAGFRRSSSLVRANWKGDDLRALHPPRSAASTFRRRLPTAHPAVEPALPAAAGEVERRLRDADRRRGLRRGPASRPRRAVEAVGGTAAGVSPARSRWPVDSAGPGSGAHRPRVLEPRDRGRAARRRGHGQEARLARAREAWDGAANRARRRLDDGPPSRHPSPGAQRLRSEAGRAPNGRNAAGMQSGGRDSELYAFLALARARSAPRTVEAYRRDLEHFGAWLKR